MVVKDSVLNAMLAISEYSFLDNHRKYDVVWSPQAKLLSK